MRIVRLANFVTGTSGGLRTALRQFGIGYQAAGHEPVLIVPGTTAGDECTPEGRRIALSGRSSPGRAVTGCPALRAELARDDEILLIHCGRLAPEKQPERSLRALARCTTAACRRCSW